MHITTIFLEHFFFPPKVLSLKAFYGTVNIVFKRHFAIFCIPLLKFLKKKKKILAFIIFCKSNSPESYVKNILFWTYYIGEYLMFSIQYFARYRTFIFMTQQMLVRFNSLLFISLHVGTTCKNSWIEAATDTNYSQPYVA